MDMLLKKYLPRIDFDSYEDFKQNFTINAPEDFNFGYDVVDAWAQAEPEKRALVWVNEANEEKIFTFTDIRRLSNQAANFFRSLGIKKGSVVMLILRRRWEYWICATALHKLGATLIPGTLQLTKKDIVYRGNSAEVCAVVCVNDPFVVSQVEAAEGEIPSLKNKIMVEEHREGWLDFNDEIAKFPEEFSRPTGEEATRWNPEVTKRWKELTGLQIYEGFGQSEGPVLLANFYPWVTPIPGSTGKPSPLYDIQLVDKEGNLCEDGDEGSLTIMDVKNHPPVGLFTGYFRNPEMTEEHLGGMGYNTGDMLWRDSDGYFWFVGRNDDVIKCSGYRIGPFEVESALIEHPAVVECAITGAPDPIRGQVVKATIVLAKGYEGTPELTKELQNYVKKVTAPYKYPRVVEYVDELPKTLGGKIKRAEIRKADEQK